MSSNNVFRIRNAKKKTEKTKQKHLMICCKRPQRSRLCSTVEKRSEERNKRRTRDARRQRPKSKQKQFMNLTGNTKKWRKEKKKIKTFCLSFNVHRVQSVTDANLFTPSNLLFYFYFSRSIFLSLPISFSLHTCIYLYRMVSGEQRQIDNQ